MMKFDDRAPKPIAAVVFLLGTFSSTNVSGQAEVSGPPFRANEAEMKVIRDYIGVESMNSDDLEKILSIDAYRWSDSEPYELAAFVWLKPIFAQGAICIVHEAVTLGRPVDEEYTWEDQHRFHHWLGDSESQCALESADQLPRSVVTRERIATDAMIQILEAEDELLEATLDQADSEVIGSLAADWRIEEISFGHSLDPELGFAYHATFRAPERGRGPTCTFTIIDGEIEIHSVGYWIS